MANGIELAKAYVQIVPSAQGVQSSLESVLNKPATAAGKSAGNSIASGLKSVMGTVGKIAAAGLAAGSTAAVAFGKSAVEAGKLFDSSMSQVAATMGVTVDEIGELRNFAQEMGRTTAFSASEAADALNYMALAGYDAETSMKTLPTVLNLAAAGGIDLAYASDMITDSQSALGLTLDQTIEMVDQMAKASSKSNTSVEQLGEAILTIGGTAQFMSGGTDRLATVLGLLADNGIKGSEAGTHLRNMLLKLSSPTKDGAAALEDLGIGIFDASGQMRDFGDIMGDFNAALGDLTDEQQIKALAEIFNTRDIAAAQALIKTSADRWEELGDAIENAGDAASDMAATQLDNLTGDITLFKSALEGAQIAISDVLTPSLRELVQFGSDGLSRLTAAFQEGGLSGALKVAGDLLQEITAKLIAKLPQLIKVGGDMVGSIVQGILDALPTLMAQLPTMLATFIDLFTQITSGLIGALPELIGTLLAALPALIPQVISGITTFITTILQSASQIIQPILDYLPEAIDALSAAILANAPALITCVSDLIQQLVEALPEILRTILGLIDTWMPELLKAAKMLLNSFVEALPIFLPVFIEAATSIIDMLLDAIDTWLPPLLEAAITLLNAFLEAIPEIITRLTETLPEIIALILDSIDEWFPDMIGAAITLLMALVDAIPTIVDALVENLPEIIDTILDAFTDNFDLILDGAVALLDAIIQAIPKIVSALTDKLPDIIDKILGSMDSWLPQLLDGAIELFMEIIHAIPTIITKLTEKLPDIIHSITKGLTEHIDDVLEAAIELFMGIVNAIPDIIVSLADALPDIVNAFIDGLAEPLGLQFDGIKEIFQGICDFISGVFSGDWSKAWDGIKAIFEGVWNTLVDIVKAPLNLIIGLINGLIGGLNWIIDGINSISFEIPDWVPFVGGKRVGFNLGRIGEVPYLAEGGVLNKPTLMVGGEDGQEAVVPLERNTGWIRQIANELSDLDDSGVTGDILDVVEGLSEKIDKMQIVLDGGQLVGGISSRMDGALGRYTNMQGRGVAFG